MIYFKLPSSPKNTFENISIKTKPNLPEVFISQSLCNYMNNIKEKISFREIEWDVYKKYTNPYEYIHSIVPQKKRSVSKYKPISRSYFKMLEMIREFNLDKPAYNYSSIVKNVEHDEFSREDENSDDLASLCRVTKRPVGFLRECKSNAAPRIFVSVLDTASRIQAEEIRRSLEHSTVLYQSEKSSKMHTFHLAEGPGGFIEAICNRRNNPEDEYYGMTIIFDETDDNVPAWHKTGHFLSQHPNITIEYGADKTGNLLHIENFEYCVEKYGGKMDLVTADGGFDFSKDFNRQEISVFNLLWGQVCYALCLQKLGGNFVLKIFDIFYEQTVHILYILSSFYEDVNVCKLKTSRIGNSEKYIVCRKFRFSSYLEFYPFIHESFSKIKQSSGMSSDSWKYFQENLQKIDIFAKEPHFAQSNMENSELYVWQLLNCEVPRYFTRQIEDINAIFGQQQIENIHYTISLIDKQPKQDKLDQLVKQNVTKCLNWCVDHGVAYNNLTMTNIFEQGNQVTSLCPSTKGTGVTHPPLELIK